MEFLLGLIVFALDVWAIVHIVGSGASTITKLLWVVAIVVLPVLGFLAWLIMGPRRNTAVTTV